MEQKIDIVIIWVDGNDKKWQKEKEYYQSLETGKTIDASIKRYREWGNLKYIFRGIEQYMPWINNVFFVTNGQKPEWLNLDCKQLRWVKHSDYIPQECLPTFNCNPIEINFHRIENLSERFIYFNDDTFVTSMTKKEDFFHNGLPCETAVINPITPRSENIVNQLWFNNTCIINKYFNKKNTIKKFRNKFYNYRYGSEMLRTYISTRWNYFLGFKFTHLPTSMLKSTFEEVWNKEYDKLYKCSLNKFRSKDDYTQYLFKDWQIASGKFYPRSPKIGKVISLTNLDDIKNAKYIIEKKKYKLLCINDNFENDSDFEQAKNDIINSFEKIFPKKSKFEV